MFNREYHRRAARLALSQAGLTLAHDPNSGFYRPAKRPDPRPKKKEPRAGPIQLQLNFYDPDKPLADVFPELYQ